MRWFHLKFWHIAILIIISLFLFGCANTQPLDNNIPPTEGNTANECVTDSDCAPAECCHPTTCMPASQKKPCNLACTMDCKPNTMDCGQGSCACIDGKCLATFEGIKPIGGENTEKDSATNTQIANPASKKCIADGGKLEIRENKEGQYGVCLLPDGTECEEWKHFRGEC